MQSKIFVVTFFLLFSAIVVSCGFLKSFYPDKEIQKDIEVLEKDSMNQIALNDQIIL